MSDTPLCDRLDADQLDSNDARAWRTLARQLESERAPVAEVGDTQAKDAARYRWIQKNVYAATHEHSGRTDFRLAVNLPQRKDTNIMRGSIVGHLDAEIDSALERLGGPGGGS